MVGLNFHLEREKKPNHSSKTCFFPTLTQEHSRKGIIKLSGSYNKRSGELVTSYAYRSECLIKLHL